MKRIAIYSYNIRMLFSGNLEEATGGAEYQLKNLAGLLRSQGFDVAFLVGDVQVNDSEIIDEYEFFKCFSNSNRTIFSKIIYLYKALKKVNADVFIERGSSTVSFWLSLFAFIKKKKYVFCSASDINFAIDKLDPTFTFGLEQIMFHLGLRMAGRIVVQKETQKVLLQKNFNKESVVIKNFPPPAFVHNGIQKEWDVIWVNNIIPYKKPESVFYLANELPSVKFVMIGGARNKMYFEEIKQKASCYPNIVFLGFVPYSEVGFYISRSRIMLNTTIVKGKYEEGFPNSMLQAWQMGVPVVSILSNPDNILLKYSIGFCSSSEGNMVNDIRNLLENKTLYNSMSTNAKLYVSNYHKTEMIFEQYKRIIEL